MPAKPELFATPSCCNRLLRQQDSPRVGIAVLLRSFQIQIKLTRLVRIAGERSVDVSANAPMHVSVVG